MRYLICGSTSGGQKVYYCDEIRDGKLIPNLTNDQDQAIPLIEHEVDTVLNCLNQRKHWLGWGFVLAFEKIPAPDE